MREQTPARRYGRKPTRDLQGLRMKTALPVIGAGIYSNGHDLHWVIVHFYS
ncbi:MAG: hypothetical protein AB7U63_17165 [Porticoccaceae bacterium]